nr:CU044_5270 family protein [Schumannella luteola]
MRAEADLARIVDGTAVARRTPRASHRPRPAVYWIIGLAAALTIALVVTLTNLGQPVPASLAAPPRLKATPIAEGSDATLARLIAAARSQPDTTAEQDFDIRIEGWYSNVTVTEKETAWVVQPQEVTLRRYADGSGRVETHAGPVRWGAEPPDLSAAPGSLISRDDYPAGEYPMLYPTPPPTTGAELRAYIEAILSGGTPDVTLTTGDYFNEAESVRNEWVLSGARSAALLELIRSLDGVEMLGRVTDRLNRPGIAFQAKSGEKGSFRTILIFDETTGALLSSERVYIGGAKDVTYPSGSVVSYTAWKDPS